MRKSETPPRRSRLGGSPDSLPVAPFHKAEDFKRCEMYWLSSSVPSTVQQRAWTLRFLADLVKRVSPQGELQPQLFVDADAIFPERQEQFVQTALDFNPIMGFSRTPGADMPSVPKTELVESIRRQEKPFTVQPFLQGICYWFLKKDFQKQLDLFWGYGGMTMLLVKPDAASQPPAVVIPAGVKKHPAYQSMSRQHDIQGLLDTAYSNQSGSLQKSKEHFGERVGDKG